mgnify:CR=1 FL=1
MVSGKVFITNLEFNKLFMKAEKPSVGLQFLKDVGAMEMYYPELNALEGCLQNPDHHSEGDVLTHTLCTADSAAHVRSQLPEEWQLPFMFGTSFHDIGKPDTRSFSHGGVTFRHHEEVLITVVLLFCIGFFFHQHQPLISPSRSQ